MLKSLYKHLSLPAFLVRTVLSIVKTDYCNAAFTSSASAKV